MEVGNQTATRFVSKDVVDAGGPCLLRGAVPSGIRAVSVVVLTWESGRNIGPSKMLGALEVRRGVDIDICDHADEVRGGADPRRSRKSKAEQSRVVSTSLSVQGGEKDSLGARLPRGGTWQESF